MKKIYVTDLVLRDAHQSLLATRMLTDDMLAIAGKLNQVGYWSLEAWGGATFDSCIRFLNEDPWERVRKLKEAMPDTKIQMLLRGQNLLGYRHYADDVVDKFVEVAAKNGVDIFRIFDALNDVRNMTASMKAVKKAGKHAQAAISYAVTPVHTIQTYVDMAVELEKLGADSLCIKDMSGLLKPYAAYELVSEIKKRVKLPLALHSHATTGLSVATLVKAIEAGADMVDTAISSLSMGTSHSPTETIVEILKDTEFNTELDTKLLSEIATYFREVRKKYADFESSFSGVDPRILLAQVPGGMLSNLENQLKEQNAVERIDEVLEEIQIVQKDFGYPPLVTPTSQIVGTQSVFNVLFGRYSRLTAESKNLLVGKYGKTPATPDAELVKKALADLEMSAPVTGRPADELPNELDKLKTELKEKTGSAVISDEDLLTYAMFPQIALKFFETRESGPVKIAPKKKAASDDGEPVKSAGVYVVNVDGRDYKVSVREEGSMIIATDPANAQANHESKGGTIIKAPVAGTTFKLIFKDDDHVKVGDTVLIIESMKMELEIKSAKEGRVHYMTRPGDQVRAGDPIAEIF